MKLTFEADLPFQQDAIKSITDLFEGQLLENINSIQTDNEVKISTSLDGLNFSVKMETGTGDTYEKANAFYSTFAFFANSPKTP